MSVVALHPRHSDCEPAAPVSGDVFGGDDRVVLEVGYGITVYPPVEEGERWRAVWYEDGQRRQAESVREDKLAAKLEKVRERLASGAEHLQRPGADLIAWYLSPDRRHRGGKPWSRRHADTQRRLCERFAAPVIATITCQDITVGHTQKIVNVAPTQGEGGTRTPVPVRAGQRRAGRRVPGQPAAAGCLVAGWRPGSA